MKGCESRVYRFSLFLQLTAQRTKEIQDAYQRRHQVIVEQPGPTTDRSSPPAAHSVSGSPLPYLTPTSSPGILTNAHLPHPGASATQLYHLHCSQWQYYVPSVTPPHHIPCTQIMHCLPHTISSHQVTSVQTQHGDAFGGQYAAHLMASQQARPPNATSKQAHSPGTRYVNSAQQIYTMSPCQTPPLTHHITPPYQPDSLPLVESKIRGVSNSPPAGRTEDGIAVYCDSSEGEERSKTGDYSLTNTSVAQDGFTSLPRSHSSIPDVCPVNSTSFEPILQHVRLQETILEYPEEDSCSVLSHSSNTSKCSGCHQGSSDSTSDSRIHASLPSQPLLLPHQKDFRQVDCHQTQAIPAWSDSGQPNYPDGPPLYPLGEDRREPEQGEHRPCACYQCIGSSQTPLRHFEQSESKGCECCQHAQPRGDGEAACARLDNLASQQKRYDSTCSQTAQIEGKVEGG